MVSPMTLFTPEDLLLYLYKESSPELTSAIDAALKEDWTLREKMQDLQSSANQLQWNPFTIADFLSHIDSRKFVVIHFVNDQARTFSIRH